MEFEGGLEPYTALSKDLNVGGVRLVPAVVAHSYEARSHVPQQHQAQTVVSDSAEEQIGGGDVKHVSTTEAEVERAKNDLANRHINPKTVKNSHSLLSGRGGRKKTTGAKKKTTTKGSKKNKKPSSKSKKNKQKKTSKTQQKKKKSTKGGKKSKSATKKKSSGKKSSKRK